MVQYVAKLICGRSDGTVAARGDYWTAVNVYNPNPRPVQVRKQFVVAPPEPPEGAQPPPPQIQIRSAILPASGAFEIDRREILGLFGQDFLKGFVVIDSGLELDVVAVYTAAAGENEPVTTLDLERVPPRRTD